MLTKEVVQAFLTKWPEHTYARLKLLKHANRVSHDGSAVAHSMDGDKWARELPGQMGRRTVASESKRRDETAT